MLVVRLLMHIRSLCQAIEAPEIAFKPVQRRIVAAFRLGAVFADILKVLANDCSCELVDAGIRREYIIA